jgi:hypothetical protein
MRRWVTASIGLVLAITSTACADRPVGVVVRNDDTVAYLVRWRPQGADEAPSPQGASEADDGLQVERNLRIEPGQTGQVTSGSGMTGVYLELAGRDPCLLLDVVLVEGTPWLVTIRAGRFQDPEQERVPTVGELPSVTECIP